MNKNKKIINSITNTPKSINIIKNLVNLVGVTIGIIISSIGVIMFLESVLKLYIFDLKQDRYNSFEYRCQQYDIDSIEAQRLIGQGDFIPMDINLKRQSNTNKIKKLTREDKRFLQNKYKECKKESKEEAEKQFQRGEKMNIAEGIAFMVTGFTLLYFYQRRKKSKK